MNASQISMMKMLVHSLGRLSDGIRIAFDHGVDVILGHSAHRLQGIEVMA